MAIIIEKLKEEHLTAAAELEAACLDTAWSVGQISEAREREDTLYLSAVKEGVLCAVASCVFSAFEAMIENVAVAASHRRHGLGRALLDRIEEAAREKQLEQISLEVASRNKAAIALYETAGFHIAGVRKGFYRRQNDDGLVMIKELK